MKGPLDRRQNVRARVRRPIQLTDQLTGSGSECELCNSARRIELVLIAISANAPAREDDADATRGNLTHVVLWAPTSMANPGSSIQRWNYYIYIYIAVKISLPVPYQWRLQLTKKSPHNLNNGTRKSCQSHP